MATVGTAHGSSGGCIAAVAAKPAAARKSVPAVARRKRDRLGREKVTAWMMEKILQRRFVFIGLRFLCLRKILRRVTKILFRRRKAETPKVSHPESAAGHLARLQLAQAGRLRAESGGTPNFRQPRRKWRRQTFAHDYFAATWKT